MNNVPEGVSKTLAALKKKNSSRLKKGELNDETQNYGPTKKSH